MGGAALHSALVFIPLGGGYVVSQVVLIHYASAAYMFLATALTLPVRWPLPPC